MAISAQLPSGSDTDDRRLDTDGSLSLPLWVRQYVDETQSRVVSSTLSRSVEMAQSGEYGLVTVRIHRAAALDPLALQRETAEAYCCIAKLLRASRACEPVRFWNFIPRIGHKLGEMRRYMVFNAGRFAAYYDWFRNVDAFDRLVPTATGVGHAAQGLVIHALAAARPGVHIMNSRQLAPRAYSPRYGPFPPCFARATLVESMGAQGWKVLVGGTAAVRGQHSMARADAHGQTVETFRNLVHLIRRADSTIRQGPAPSRPTASELSCFDSLRVYVRRLGDLPAIKPLVLRKFSHLPDIEFLRADICRPELLVEIEGTANVGGESG